MSVTMLLALLLALQSGPAANAPSPLDGRWRLVSRGVTSVPVVEELLVREHTTLSLLSVEQRTSTGAEWVRFTIVNPSTTQQTVLLPRDVGGRYVVLIGAAQVETLSAAGDITGQPYLYALVGSTNPGRISAHLQGQQLRGQPTRPLQWVTMSGVFQMPEDAYQITFELSRASKRGGTEPGGVARYDNLGVHAFETEEEARAFIASWRGR